MGLALQNPNDFSDLTSHRYLTGGCGPDVQSRDRARRQWHNPHRRNHPSRPHDWSRNKLTKIAKSFDAAPLPDDWAPRHEALSAHAIGLPTQHVAALASVTGRGRRNNDLVFRRHSSYLHAVSTSAAQGAERQSRFVKGYIDDDDSGLDLARSNVPLPSDNDRTVRVPSPPALEWQDAFRDRRTAKTLRDPGPGWDGGDAANDEDLYRLGLLYDDERERGSGFCLENIERAEPIYTVKFATRSSKRGQKRPADEMSWVGDLPLELSFSGFGDDEQLAAFLMSPGVEDVVDLGVDQVMVGADPVSEPSGSVGPESRHATMTVIYEADEDEVDQGSVLGETEDSWSIMDDDTDQEGLDFRTPNSRPSSTSQLPVDTFTSNTDTSSDPDSWILLQLR